MVVEADLLVRTVGILDFSQRLQDEVDPLLLGGSESRVHAVELPAKAADHTVMQTLLLADDQRAVVVQGHVFVLSKNEPNNVY